MARLRLFLLVASAGPAHADQPLPGGWRVLHLAPPSHHIQFLDPVHSSGFSDAAQRVGGRCL